LVHTTLLHSSLQPGAAGLADSIRKPIQEAFTVIIVTKVIAAFYSSRHDRMNQPGNIQPWLPWHINHLFIFSDFNR
jgi:hypothetical protein